MWPGVDYSGDGRKNAPDVWQQPSRLSGDEGRRYRLGMETEILALVVAHGTGWTGWMHGVAKTGLSDPSAASFCRCGGPIVLEIISHGYGRIIGRLDERCGK